MTYLDTNILVYLLERHAGYSERVAGSLEELSQGGGSFITSSVTVTEFLAGTVSSSLDTLRQVPKLAFIELDEALAEKAALLQRKENLQIGDAIHLATAIKSGAKLFFTNDQKLARVATNYLTVKTLKKS